MHTCTPCVLLPLGGSVVVEIVVVVEVVVALSSIAVRSAFGGP